MAAITEDAQLLAEIALHDRRRDSALVETERVNKEIEELKGVLAAAQRGLSSLKAGDRVRIERFAEAPRLNGKEGEVTSKDAKRGRFRVRLQSGEQVQVPVNCLWPAAVQRPAGDPPKPLLSSEGLRLRACLPEEGGGHPSELIPLVHSGVVRVELPEAVVQRLCAQIDKAALRLSEFDRSHLLDGEIRDGCQVTIERPDKEFEELLLEACHTLAWSILGTSEFRCEVDAVWGVVQREGDYYPLSAFRNSKSPDGFTAFVDVELPPCLSAENHERPTKGAYGFHDGIHNLLWKSDRTSDQNDLVQPGIVQCELVTGYMHVYPHWIQSYTYPFEGQGDRKWIAASVALLDVAPEVN